MIQLVIQDISAGIINHSSDCTPTVSVQHTTTSLKHMKRTEEKFHQRFSEKLMHHLLKLASLMRTQSKNRKQRWS